MKSVSKKKLNQLMEKNKKLNDKLKVKVKGTITELRSENKTAVQDAKFWENRACTAEDELACKFTFTLMHYHTCPPYINTHTIIMRVCIRIQV